MPNEAPHWRIPRMTPAQPNMNPFQGAFFDSNSPIAERLVRESIQNSMDARLDSATPVTVRFTFSGKSGALPTSDAAILLQGLQKHLEAGAPPGMPGNPSAYFERPMPFLTIEDFGTTGLIGDVRHNDSSGDGNDFWGLFRSIGISTKTGDEGGSWGLGKWVFPDASDINVFLGITKRVDDDQLYLMGQTVIQIHEIGRDKYPPYGWFAAYSDKDDANWFPMPVEAQEFIHDVTRLFQLMRGVGDHPANGLSVIIPFPDEELTPESLIRAVITQYFMPVIRSDLRVEIAHPDKGETIIDNGTIREVAKTIEASDRDDESPEAMVKTIDLAEWLQKIGWHEIESFDATERTFPVTDSQKERFIENRPLAFKLNLKSQRRGERHKKDEFHVVLERDESLDKGHDYYIRGFLRIPQMDYISRYKARALIVVYGAGSQIGQLLRDAEGPAHMRWDDNARGLATHGWAPGSSQRIKDVRSAAAKLLHALIDQPGQVDINVLADLFPARTPTEGPGPGGPNGGSGGDDRRPGGMDSPFDIQVTNATKGVRITAKPGTAKERGSWRLRIAYETSRGNPLRAFERSKEDGTPDFSMLKPGNTLRVGGQGYRGTIIAENVLEFSIISDKATIAIQGFDGVRDVVTDLEPLSNKTDTGLAGEDA